LQKRLHQHSAAYKWSLSSLISTPDSRLPAPSFWNFRLDYAETSGTEI
jgi:hypothetical protein